MRLRALAAAAGLPPVLEQRRPASELAAPAVPEVVAAPNLSAVTTALRGRIERSTAVVRGGRRDGPVRRA